jgi:tetratricopeptide (TPR) repeat protein
MLRARLILILLLVACFSLAAYLQPRQQAMQAAQGQSASGLALLLGDGREMIADRMLAKADAYFHRGKYPSIFEQNAQAEENHMSAEAGGHDEHGDKDHDEHEDEGRPPLDWIEAFGRHFIPDQHVHLEHGYEREMLPWLRFSAELNPHHVETYTMTAYWLRERLGKVDDAEQFLRDGLKANPNSPELLYELGRLYLESRKDLPRAKNLFLAALRKWQEVEGPKPEKTENGEGERNVHLKGQILDKLAEEEIAAGRIPQAIEYFKQAKEFSPFPDEVQKRIDELQATLQKGSGQTNQTAPH